MAAPPALHPVSHVSVLRDRGERANLAGKYLARFGINRVVNVADAIMKSASAEDSCCFDRVSRSWRGRMIFSSSGRNPSSKRVSASSITTYFVSVSNIVPDCYVSMCVSAVRA